MPTPLFPVPKPFAGTPEEALTALQGLAHLVEVKEGYALVHASPMGVVKITELGLPVFPSKRGGEYYAVRVGVKAPVDPPKGSPLDIKGVEYRVLETAPKRKQDLRRFEVAKADGSSDNKPYVVSFQATGAACSCPDWIYRRRQCKHITAIQSGLGLENQAAQAA